MKPYKFCKLEFIFIPLILIFSHQLTAKTYSLKIQSRSSKVVVPNSSKSNQKHPLVVLLHGYGTNAFQQNLYLQFSRSASKLGMISLLPNGTKDSKGKRFWNASPSACCNYDNKDVDDVSYLLSLIEEVKKRFPVDPEKVFLFGHSNGGFMAYRMACMAPKGVLKGIGVLAGSSVMDPKDCPKSYPLSLLHIHGTNDKDIQFKGGLEKNGEAFPPAFEMVRRYVQRNIPTQFEASPRSLSLTYFGRKETDTHFWSQGEEESMVTFWVMNGVGHLPMRRGDFMKKALECLFYQDRSHCSGAQ